MICKFQLCMISLVRIFMSFISIKFISIVYISHDISFDIDNTWVLTLLKHLVDRLFVFCFCSGHQQRNHQTTYLGTFYGNPGEDRNTEVWYHDVIIRFCIGLRILDKCCSLMHIKVFVNTCFFSSAFCNAYIVAHSGSMSSYPCCCTETLTPYQWSNHKI